MKNNSGYRTIPMTFNRRAVIASAEVSSQNILSTLLFYNENINFTQNCSMKRNTFLKVQSPGNYSNTLVPKTNLTFHQGSFNEVMVTPSLEEV